MPELPEVETMVRGLRPALEGRTIRALRAQAARAAALAKRAAPCPTGAPCDLAIFRRINPFLVRGRLEAARPIRNRYS